MSTADTVAAVLRAWASEEDVEGEIVAVAPPLGSPEEVAEWMLDRLDRAGLQVLTKEPPPDASQNAPHYWVGNRGVATGGNIPSAPRDDLRVALLDAVVRLPEPTLGLRGGVNRGAVIDAINATFRSFFAATPEEGQPG